MAAQGLQFEHQPGQAVRRQFYAHASLADGEILAEDTAQRAVGKEDRAAAAPAAQAIFLARVRKAAADACKAARFADAGFAGQPVHGARARAEAAVSQAGQSLFCPGLQFAAAMQRAIGWLIVMAGSHDQR